MSTSQEALFIDGDWAPPSSAATIEVRNASTGEHVAAVPDGAEADIDAAVAAARRAFDDPAGWSSWPPRWGLAVSMSVIMVSRLAISAYSRAFSTDVAICGARSERRR